ncbi:MAG: hypothetical protein HY673_24850, partial [Chloroflexi bacterium]|nr:hypothetical protein [Chloroflexota bacterium]
MSVVSDGRYKLFSIAAIGLVVALLLVPLATLAANGGLQNPGFEGGALNGPPNSWTVQQPPADAAVVVGSEGPGDFAAYRDMGSITVTPPKGNAMLRLGTPKRTAEKQPPGENTVYQDFTSSSDTLSFYFRLLSWEARGQDVFRFNLTNTGGSSVGTLKPFTMNMGGNLVTKSTLPVETTLSLPKGAKFVDTTWVKVEITGIPQNQNLRLTYTVGGTKDNAHATWAYFDGNTPPAVSADQTAVASGEGQTATNTGRYSDADSDPVSLSASVGSVSPGATAGTWVWSHTGADGPAQNTVTITANDGNGGVTSATFSLTINNVAPAGVALTASPAAINENDSTTVSGSFTDPGTLDTHTVAIDWGDGSPVTTLNLAANVLTF